MVKAVCKSMIFFFDIFAMTYTRAESLRVTYKSGSFQSANVHRLPILCKYNVLHDLRSVADLRGGRGA